MTAKLRPMKKEKALNSILGVNIGMPVSDTGVMELTAENVIAAYKKQAAAILKRDGYPPTIEELWAKKDELLPDLANGKGLAQVYSIFWMLWFFKRVQVDIKENNTDMAACDMASAINWATTAQLKPIAQFFEMGKSNVDGGISGGKISGEIRREKSKPKKDCWQAEAEKIWKKHPTWSKSLIAKKVAEKIGGNIDTIRKSIRKPLP